MVDFTNAEHDEAPEHGAITCDCGCVVHTVQMSHDILVAVECMRVLAAMLFAEMVEPESVPEHLRKVTLSTIVQNCSNVLGDSGSDGEEVE